MDLEFKAPSLESFYSPNHQQHSLSPIWTDKDKAEDDVDTAISDGDDQGSVQGTDIENSDDHACNDSLNDALDWENGIGSLAGSDLKFRMNEHGDIEVITECLELGNDVPITKNCDNRENLTREISNSPKTNHQTSDIFVGSEPNTMTHKENFVIDSGDERKIPENNFDAHVVMNSETSLMLQEVEQQKNGEKGYNIENLAESVESPSSKKDEAVSPSLEDQLLEFDPVLSEDMATMLYGNATEEHKKDEIDHSEAKFEYTGENNLDSFEKNEPKIRPLSSEKTTEPGKCIICGRPSTLANRFCSRQCIGKNAAKQRKVNLLNQSSVNKKSKVGRKKSFSTRRHHEYSSPHPNDVLTVVHDESLGKRNDLKIKIRWSSSVSNENHDEEYSSEPRETSKRRAATTTSSYAGCIRGTRRKRFSWSSYILQENATAAPPEAFEEIIRKDPFPTYNGFHIGMTLEGVDPEHEALICPLFVAEVRGCRIRLSFCGYSDSHDFWKDVDSRLIFPCGFCKETNRTLQPPKGYKGQDFDWEDHLKLYRLTKAPEELFTTKAMSSLDSAEKFAVGQKLEAVDKHNPGLVCVATIQDAIDGLVLIHFDGWSHNFDYWCSVTSKHIHPIGWCQENGKELSPPLGYDESKTFSWENFLAETSSTAADRRLFSNLTTHHFEVGTKIEVVDPRNKILVRVASIIEIDDFKVKIHFDGWSDMYDFWTHLEEEDIHPVGWCEKTGHTLESPICLDENSENSWQASGCPIPGCSGIGHVHGAKFQNHYSEFGCPYSPQNLTKEHIKDRLTTHKQRRRTQAKEGADFYIEEYRDDEFQDVSICRSTKASNCKRNRSFSNPPSPMPGRKRTRGRPEATQDLEDPSHNIDLVSKWSTKDVAEFVEEVTNEPLYGKIFSSEEIDGRAILLMSQADILTVLKIKLGPAVKIYNAILTIKEM